MYPDAQPQGRESIERLRPEFVERDTTPFSLLSPSILGSIINTASLGKTNDAHLQALSF